jgi:NMD protein affecting ribosome stability and mRNA decay
MEIGIDILIEKHTINSVQTGRCVIKHMVTLQIFDFKPDTFICKNYAQIRSLNPEIIYL